MNAKYSALLSVALMVGMIFLPGCHNASAEPAAPTAALVYSDALPAGVPAASPLFAAMFVPASVNVLQVIRAPLPPEPTDPDVIVKQAVEHPRSKVSTAAASANGKIIPADVGLLVCDPVLSASSPSTLGDFGEGCGQWLHLMAAGQPEFGRTPLWFARARIQQELGRSDLRLTPAAITALSHMAGITYAACGTISGTSGHCMLLYTLYSVQSRLPIGAPLTETGTLPQIEAALPEMAHALDTRLGLIHAPLPASPMLSADELTRLGADAEGASISDSELLAVAQLSARSPLAGVLLLQTRAMRDQLLLNKTVKTLMTQQPQNPLVLSELGAVARGALTPYAAQTSLLFHRFPQSALLAHMEIWEQRVLGSRNAELAAAERVTADAPNDPDSWLTSGFTLSRIGQDLRQGRIADDLSPPEWSFLRRIYGQWENHTLEATRLDPKYGHAWCDLAEAATFAGDDQRAVAAFWQAQALDQDKAEVYTWGLQMFQPKWEDDPAALEKVANLASAQAYDSADEAIEVARGLKDASIATKNLKYDEMSTQVLAQAVTADRAAATK